MPKIIINGKVYNKDVLDIKDKIVSFNDSNNREKNINSKESISTLISRIKKWLYDLHEVAYSGSYNDLSNKPTIPSAVRVKGNRETAYRAGDVNLTVGNIGAVPDYNSTIIGPNVDWNTIIAVGAHRIEGATMDEAHHAPVNVHNYGIVYVLLDSSNGRLAQIYTPHATGGTQQIQYPIFTIRWRSGSSWGGWIPTYGRTFNDSRYLLKAGDTMTGNLVLNKDETVNGIATFKRSTGQGVYKGANGTSGWVVFAQIKISVAYRNFTIEFEVGGRARTLGTILGVMFGNVSSTDPALSEFVYYGGPGNIFRLKKTATSTWQLAAQKSEMYGEIYVMRVHSEYDFLHDGSIIITYPNTQLTSVDGWTAPTLGGNIGYASSATKLATARTIDGVNFNGTANIIHYGTCSTAAATAAKVVACAGFALVTGADITVKFTVTNTAANPTLNVNSTGAKAIYYRGAAITAGYLAANRTYKFVYNGTQFELIGDIDTNTNTTYSNMTAATASTAGKAGLVPAPGAGAQAKFLRGDGMWAVPPDTNTTYSNFVKSGSGAKAGLVPAPSTTAGTRKYLREDGTWAVPPDTNTTYSVATTTKNGLMSMNDVKKLSFFAININATIDAIASGTNSIALGYKANASGNNSTALGLIAIASNSDSTALGYNSNASALYCTSLGSYTIASGTNSTALGSSAKAPATQCTALGSMSNAAGQYSTSIGFQSKTEGKYSIAIGYSARSASSYDISIGYTAQASGMYSIAIGNAANSSGSRSVAIGVMATVPSTSSNTIQLGDASISSLKCARSLTVTSDERDKTDIAEIDNGAIDFLNKIRAIRYVSNNRVEYIDSENLSEEEKEKLYKYGICEYDRDSYSKGTKKGTRKQVGVSAQQVQKALREIYGDASYANLVDDNLFDIKDKSNIPDNIESQLSVNYSGFIPFLIKAIQELSTKVKEQNERIELLEELNS